MIKFIKKSLLYYLPIILSFLWGNRATGELGRLSGIPFGHYQPNFEYPQDNYHHIYQNIIGIDTTDILIVGDSYAHNQIHAWFQYYAERETGIDIRTLSWPQGNFHPIGIVHNLLNRNLIDSCRIVIIESAERLFVERLLNYETVFDIQQIDNICKSQDTVQYFTVKYGGDVEFYSLKHIANATKFALKLKKTDIIQLQLSNSFFSSKYHSKSLVFNIAETNFLRYNTADLSLAKSKLIELHERALEHGIFLIFMVAAGSYDLYQDYIVDNPYPRDTTLDYFDDLDTSWFLNTKKLIKPHIDAGEKDMVLLNDTHWSIKSAKLAGEKLGEMINDYFRKIESINTSNQNQ